MKMDDVFKAAEEALGVPVAEPGLRNGRVVAVYPAIRTIDLGGQVVEFAQPGIGPALVDVISGEVEALGSSIFSWPEWLADDEGEDVYRE